MPADGLYKLSFHQLRDIRGEADARVREGTFVFTLKQLAFGRNNLLGVPVTGQRSTFTAAVSRSSQESIL